ncbi:MAG: hypothetical protein ACOC83_07200 [Gemmatimonadota bacterium]
MEPEDDAGTTGGRSQTDARVGRLQAAVVLLGLAWVGTVGWIALRPAPTPAVLTVERLEVVEPDGQPAFVLANSERPAPAIMDGEVLMAGQEEERSVPSVIFFDGHGDEVGGMLFSNESTEEGFSATRHLSLDGHKQDQTVVLHHYQDPSGAHAGLTVSDRPEDLSLTDAMAALGLEPGHTRDQLTSAVEQVPEEVRSDSLRQLFGVQRLFVGSDRGGDASLELRDGAGRPRIRISVPEEGDPSIRILDEEEDTVAQLPG